MRNCFVPGCDRKNKRKRAMFTVPKDQALFAKWTEVLPKQRVLKHHDRVCILHFLPHEVQNTFKHTINGQLYQLERDRMRMAANAVPSQNLPSDEELLLLKHRRKSATKCVNAAVKNSTAGRLTERGQLESTTAITLGERLLLRQEIDIVAEVTNTLEVEVVQQEEEAEPQQEELHEEEMAYLFNDLYENICEVVLPSTLWGIHRCPQRTVLLFNCMDTTLLQPTKMLTIDASGVMKMYFASHHINTLDLRRDAPDYLAVSALLAELDDTRICAGAGVAEDCAIVIRPAEQKNVEAQLCNQCLVESITQQVLFN